MTEHQTGDFVLKELLKREDELELLYAHLKAVVANPDPNWTGWRHAIEMLIPDSPPRIAELKERLRAGNLGALADRLDYLERPPTEDDR